MKLVAIFVLTVVAAMSMAQTHYVEGHTTKSGKFIPGHWVKDRKSTPPSPHTGRHREHRFYEGHYAADGHYIKPHWRWVWVKD